MDQHGPQVGITSLAHAEQVLLAAAGMLARNEPQPCGQLAPVVEVLRVADRGDEGRCRERANPGHLLQALAGFAVAMPGLDLGFDLVDLAM